LGFRVLWRPTDKWPPKKAAAAKIGRPTSLTARGASPATRTRRRRPAGSTPVVAGIVQARALHLPGRLRHKTWLNAGIRAMVRRPCRAHPDAESRGNAPRYGTHEVISGWAFARSWEAPSVAPAKAPGRYEWLQSEPPQRVGRLLAQRCGVAVTHDRAPKRLMILGRLPINPLWTPISSRIASFRPPSGGCVYPAPTIPTRLAPSSRTSERSHWPAPPPGHRSQ